LVRFGSSVGEVLAEVELPVGGPQVVAASIDVEQDDGPAGLDHIDQVLALARPAVHALDLGAQHAIDLAGLDHRDDLRPVLARLLGAA